jgi:hypothetical protein
VIRNESPWLLGSVNAWFSREIGDACRWLAAGEMA